MNNHLSWSNDLEIGVESLDLQHHYFLNLINRVEKELKNSNHKKYRACLFSELLAYARFHAISEENIMAKAGFPGLDGHHKYHELLINHLAEKQRAISLNPTPENETDFLQYLTKWFFEHTQKEDRVFAKFFLENNNNSSSAQD
jgi:hemerythrin